MRIAVMGTGGVGGFFGARLAAAGEDVTFIARGAQLRALKEEGLRIESEVAPLHIRPKSATDDPASLPPQDFILFCVKLWDVEAAAEQMRPMVGPETTIIALQNGVDSEDRVGAVLGPEHVMGGVVHISATVTEPGVVVHTGKLQRLFYGEMDGTMSERGENFRKVCGRAGIEARFTDRIVEAIWDKFIFLVAFSGMTALVRLGIGPIRDDPETAAMFTAAMAEAASVAKAKGVAFTGEPVANWQKAILTMPYNFRASMLEDLERGRRLELPWLSGAVARMGRELGVATPVNAFINAALKLHANPAARKAP